MARQKRAEMLPVAILCGGLGTRMRAVAADLPKALIRVAGQPLLFHQLRWLRSSGARDVVLCVGFGADAIREAVGNGSAFGLSIAYSDDGKRLRGTAGSLMNALPLLGERFFAMYGDSLLVCDPLKIAKIFIESDALALMTVLRNDDRWLRSNVRIEGDRVSCYDKKAALGTMTHIDYGLNAFKADAFDGIDATHAVDLAAVHCPLILKRMVRAFTVVDRFHEIGSPEGLLETEAFLASEATYRGRLHEQF